MATYNKFQKYTEDLARGVHNFGTHTVKVYLTNAAPNASTHTIKADIAEISAGGGYTAGGPSVAVAVSRSAGTTSVTGTDVTITATGAVGPFRYAVLYNDTPTSPADPLIAWWDYGSSLTLATGESFTVDFGASLHTIV
jgi:hypothetical protein